MEPTELPSEPVNSNATSSMPLVVYILYLVGLIIPLTPIIGLIMAYVLKGDSPDWQLTHYRFQIRTFWIGLLFGVINIILIFILIGYLTSILLLIWWVVRCVKGIMHHSKNEPVANPTSWMFG